MTPPKAKVRQGAEDAVDLGVLVAEQWDDMRRYTARACGTVITRHVPMGGFYDFREADFQPWLDECAGDIVNALEALRFDCSGGADLGHPSPRSVRLGLIGALFHIDQVDAVFRRQAPDRRRSDKPWYGRGSRKVLNRRMGDFLRDLAARADEDDL